MSAQSIHGGLMDGALAKIFFSTIQQNLFLRHSCLIANNSMVIVTMMLGRLIVGSFFTEDTSPCLLLPWDPNGSIAVRTRGCSSRINSPDLGCWTFPITFDLDYVQEVTPILMSQVTIVPLIILQLILHGWGESVLNCNSNIINREFFVAYFPISCFITIALHRRVNQLLC